MTNQTATTTATHVPSSLGWVIHVPVDATTVRLVEMIVELGLVAPPNLSHDEMVTFLKTA